jgi:hypothetical protein
MSCRQTNRRTIVEVVCLTVCMCQIDSSCLHCCTCPNGTVQSMAKSHASRFHRHKNNANAKREKKTLHTTAGTGEPARVKWSFFTDSAKYNGD